MQLKKASLLTKLVVLALLVFVASALLGLRTQIQAAQADLDQLTAQKAAPIKAVPAPTQRPYTRRNSSGTLRFARGDAVMYPRMFITPPPRPKRPTNNSNRESNGNASFSLILSGVFPHLPNVFT